MFLYWYLCIPWQVDYARFNNLRNFRTFAVCGVVNFSLLRSAIIKLRAILSIGSIVKNVGQSISAGTKKVFLLVKLIYPGSLIFILLIYSIWTCGLYVFELMKQQFNIFTQMLFLSGIELVDPSSWHNECVHETTQNKNKINFDNSQ